ncbi:putative protease Do-like 14 [Telopea speciosissima]|uniref:putative protease Do-like 14 n=1 Tax=Telopea speciosissima TaxID=54955 RepID=UPI001CC6A96C|nr:putative protease Do-like 14 [Telopea speciosissima]
MRDLLNKLSLLSQRPIKSSGRSLVIEIAALAAAGAGVLWSNDRNSDTKTTISVSVSPQLRELAFLACPAKVETPPFLPSDDSPLGLKRLLFSRTDSVPSTDYRKDASGEVGDGSKCCPGCLGRDSIANAASTVGPAVVNLSVAQGLYGMPLGKSIGSGTIIDSDGTILTCAHVVVDFQSMRTVSKGKVDVTLQDGRMFEGTVVNADFHSDIAVVKIKSKTPLPTAKLGSSFKLRPGDWVIAMGCPLSLQNTITAGIVSCVDRKSSDLGLGGMHREYLQTDCAINEGNSGGPLVNLNGEVVGVNIMKIMAADGLSFAVPIDSVSKIVEHFKKIGRVVRPWLGLKMLDLNELIIAQLKERDPMFPDVSKGVLVTMVTPGSPADHAGFRPRDVVIEFEGKPVGSIKEIIEIMRDKVGRPLKVIVKRGNTNLVSLIVVPEEGNPDM